MQRVLTQMVDGQKRAVGIVANVGDFRVQVNARSCVIVAAGSLNTPCLLQRSGFRNPHIGRHLHLHPVTAAVGFFNDEIIHAYLGAPMTTVCNEFPNVKVECPSAHRSCSRGVALSKSSRFQGQNAPLKAHGTLDGFATRYGKRRTGTCG